MKRSIFSIAIAAMMAIFATQNADSQVREGLFGIGANFNSDNQTASLYYAADPQFDLSLMFGFSQFTEDDADAINAFTAGAQFRYILDEGNSKIDPYIFVMGQYSVDDMFTGTNLNNVGGQDYANFGIGAGFGGQAEVSDNFYVTAQLGAMFESIGYTDANRVNSGDESPEITSTRLTLGGSRIGAIWYFD